jgi:hypothetical protein
MPDMSEYHETEDEMNERCESMRDAEKDAFPVEPVHPLTAMLDRLRKAGEKKTDTEHNTYAGYPDGEPRRFNFVADFDEDGRKR